MKNKTKILIIVEGGIVQQVLADGEEVRVVIIDFDKQSDEPCIVAEHEIEKLNPHTGPKNFYELYTDKTDPQEMEIRDELKRLKF